MGVNGIGMTGYPIWHKAERPQTNMSGMGFAQKMEVYLASSVSPMYSALSAPVARNERPAYETYESENYRIVPDNEAGCFDIYNKQGERLGAFMYDDIRIREDAAAGSRFLISEHGTMSYDAMVIDDELKADLQSVMGIDELEAEELYGFTLKTHFGTGIQYLIKDGEELRGGKVLLQNEEDRRQYEALAQSYFSRYSNLIGSREEAYIWADLEIKGMARRMEKGFLSIGYDGMAYHDNEDAGKNWNAWWSPNVLHGGNWMR